MSNETEIIEAMGFELAAAALRAGEPTTAAAVLAATQYRLDEVVQQPVLDAVTMAYVKNWLADYDRDHTIPTPPKARNYAVENLDRIAEACMIDRYFVWPHRFIAGVDAHLTLKADGEVIQHHAIAEEDDDA